MPASQAAVAMTNIVFPRQTIQTDEGSRDGDIIPRAKITRESNKVSRALSLSRASELRLCQGCLPSGNPTRFCEHFSFSRVLSLQTSSLKMFFDEEKIDMGDTIL